MKAKKKRTYSELPFTTKLRIKENSIKTRQEKIRKGEEFRIGFVLSREYAERFKKLMTLTGAPNQTELLRWLIDGKVSLVHIMECQDKNKN